MNGAWNTRKEGKGMQDEEKVRVMSEQEKESYRGTTIDSQTGAFEDDNAQRPEQQNPFFHIFHSSEPRMENVTHASGLWDLLWNHTSWKTKGLALLSAFALLSLFLFALPFLLSGLGAVLILWLVYAFFMRH